MRIATWNINGVRARHANLLAWLDQAKPDIFCLQELKCIDDAFPRAEMEERGYNVAVHGQKGFNGVAILSRFPLEDVRTGLPGDGDDAQARYIEATVSVDGGVVRVGGLYLPNGNPVDSEKFAYKLAWMERLTAHAASLLALEECFVLAGDYNVIPTSDDVYDPRGWENDALFREESRRAYRTLLALGLTDAIAAVAPGGRNFTFWDYQAGAWPRNMGLRIDHILLSPQAADRLAAAGIERDPRAWEKPSDHVPVWVELRA